MAIHQFYLYHKIFQGLVSHCALGVRDLLADLASLPGNDCCKTAVSLGHWSDTSQQDNVPAGRLLPRKPHAVLFSCCCNARVIAGIQCICSSFLQEGMARQGCGFQMFLGASAVGEAYPFYLKRCLLGRRQMFVHGSNMSIVIRCLFRENSARTIEFSIAFVLLSLLVGWLVYVCFFLKGTLVSCVKRNYGFGFSVFPPCSATSLS